MNDYVSNTTFDEIAARLAAAQRVLLTTHVKPDGDGIGSALAMARAQVAHGTGSTSDIYIMGPVEARLEGIVAGTPYHLVADGQPDDDYDLAVVLDTGAWTQVGPLEAWLRKHHDIVVGIDHHAKGDDVAAQRLIDAGAASTTQMMVPLLEALGWPITPGEAGVAEAIFVGLATDTGWFRYSNATADSLRLAARLLEMDVDKDRLYQLIEETFRPQRLQLQARALASLEYHFKGEVAIMTLGHNDMIETGGLPEDLAELVNTPMVVGAIRVSILAAEMTPGRTKLSLRSKPSVSNDVSDTAIDMNVLAQVFGGGGHMHAAGAVVNMPVAKTREAVVKAIEEMSRKAQRH